jgi:hypothetical protein
MPKGLTVWRKEPGVRAQRVDLCSQILTLIEKKERKEELQTYAKLLYTHRFNFNWQK